MTQSEEHFTEEGSNGMTAVSFRKGTIRWNKMKCYKYINGNHRLCNWWGSDVAGEWYLEEKDKRFKTQP